MASSGEITASLKSFEENYNNNRRLKMMNRDWNRVVLVQANDIASTHVLCLQDGTLTLANGAVENPDLQVIADSETLTDLFYGDITPTEPYMNGTLKILGSEEDVLRLDFISLMIWGE